MTSIRFVGDLPLWLGGLLAVAAAVMTWRYYRRENAILSATYRWLLPTLRGIALILAILILTGPVLHHRQVIGELGQVKLYLDASASMKFTDQPMSSGRKLLIARRLGWLDTEALDLRIYGFIEQLDDIRMQFRLASEQEGIPDALKKLQSLLSEFRTQLDPPEQANLDTHLMTPLDATLAEATTAPDASLQQMVERLLQMESDLWNAWDAEIDEQILRGNESLAAAIALFDETPRWQRLEQAMLDQQTGLVEHLRSFHDVEVYALIGTEAQELSPEGGRASGNQTSFLGASRFSSTTDLSSGIRATQQAAAIATADSQLLPESPSRSAVVLLSDGQHNSGPSPVELSRLLAGQGIPIFAVATGARRPANDLAVVALDYPDRVFRRDRVRGLMIIRDQAEAGQPLLAQIKSGDDVLWQQSLLTQGTGERRIEFDFPIEAEVDRLDKLPGDNVEKHVVPLELQASVAPLTGETELTNNHRPMRLGVVTQSYRVLLLDGRSRWETRYLRNAFERDSRWSVSTVIAGGGTEHASLPRGDGDDQFPLTREALFDYDLIVLGEISAELFVDYELQWLQSFVTERGGGLILIDGQRSKLRQLSDAGLAPLIPIDWLAEPVSSSPQLFDLTTAGASEPALRLQSETADNRRFWSELPVTKSLVATRALPGSTVLVEADVAGQRYPAIVTRQVGAGRTLYFAFDETWRWRYKSADTWHQRVWNQLAIFAMPPPFTASDDYLAIDTGGLTYEPGDTVAIRIRLDDVNGQPNPGAIVDALIWSEDRLIATVSLTADESVPGTYRGQTSPLAPGEYRVTVRASGYSDQALQASTEFLVNADDSNEMIETHVNERLLEQMTLAIGGRFLREEQLDQLADYLRPISSGRVIESETLIWQSYGWFAAVILLLSVEWFLRKKAGLL